MCITCCILLAVSVNSYLSTNENYKFRSILDAVDANLQTDYASQGMVTKYKNYNDVYVKYRYNGLNKDVDSVLVILICVIMDITVIMYIQFVVKLKLTMRLSV